MVESVTVRAPAKINLHLGVGPVRDDGFHPLCTVYQAISLYDDVTVSPAPTWIVELDDPDRFAGTVPCDDTNLAVVAGKALTAHHGVKEFARIEIHKGIPVAGGMAGGSADAAATLVALDRLWGLDTTDEDLLALAAELGSDVPFALIGGTAMGTGRGEVLEPVRAEADLWWTVVAHDFGLSTPAVYRHFDELAHDTSGLALPTELIEALHQGDRGGVLAALSNDLAVPAYSLREELAGWADRLEQITGGEVLLSGSGPTQLIGHTDADSARAASRALAEAGIEHATAHGPVAGAHVVSYG